MGRRYAGDRRALFSLVTLLSFLGFARRSDTRGAPYLLVLDVLFCLGIVTMVVASLLLAYMVI